MVEKTKATIKEKFSGFEYPIHVIGRHVDITDPIKAYAVDKLAKSERFGGHVIDATIIMNIQKLVHSVDFILDVNNHKIKVSGRSENMYTSIDQAVAKLEAKLRRYTGRLREHHSKPISAIEMNVNVIGVVSPTDEVNDQIEEENLRQIEKELRPHQIVSRKKRMLKTLDRETALIRMELSEDNFLIYKCEEDQKLKVLYRRDDENYGIIELES